MCSSDIFLALLALLFPPIAVWIKRGICSADSVINLALCCLGFVPGLIHAWYDRFSPPTLPFPLHHLPKSDPLVALCPLIPIHTDNCVYVRRYIIAKYPEPSDSYEPIPSEAENGRVTYYYVSGQGQGAQGAPPQGGRGQWSAPQQPQGYGTVSAPTTQGVGNGEGGSNQSGVLPSYEQAVKGDNKVQT